MIIKTPYQKIFTKDSDLSLFMIDIINLATAKKINFLYPGYKKSEALSVSVYTVKDALAALRDSSGNPISDGTRTITPPNTYKDDYISMEANALDHLESFGFQTEGNAKQLLSFFNLRIALGFDRGEAIHDPKYNTTAYIFGGLHDYDQNRFIFCYLNIWPYERTWRMSISKGNVDEEQNNILAQNLISGYFQTELVTLR